jgi:hypothetical protein
MKQYFRKILVIFITILTLGMYVPPLLLNVEASDVDSSKAKINDESQASHSNFVHSTQQLRTHDQSIWTFNEMINLAKNQTITKLGPKIVDTLEKSFLEDVLDNMEIAVSNIIMDLGTDNTYFYGISEDLTPGYGEKIFELYDIRTNETIARFDVSRVNKPMEGHWFHFHYHLAQDNFTEHYTIGEIFYNKNTPPKWMSL